MVLLIGDKYSTSVITRESNSGPVNSSVSVVTQESEMGKNMGENKYFTISKKCLLWHTLHFCLHKLKLYQIFFLIFIYNCKKFQQLHGGVWSKVFRLDHTLFILCMNVTFFLFFKFHIFIVQMIEFSFKCKNWMQNLICSGFSFILLGQNYACKLKHVKRPLASHRET